MPTESTNRKDFPVSSFHIYVYLNPLRSFLLPEEKLIKQNKYYRDR